MTTKLPFKKETLQEKKTRMANEVKLYEKKSRAWLETPPRNWTSAILRAWYKDRPHLIADEKHTSLQLSELRGGGGPRAASR